VISLLLSHSKISSKAFTRCARESLFLTFAPSMKLTLALRGRLRRFKSFQTICREK